MNALSILIPKLKKQYNSIQRSSFTCQHIHVHGDKRGDLHYHHHQSNRLLGWSVTEGPTSMTRNRRNFSFLNSENSFHSKTFLVPGFFFGNSVESAIPSIWLFLQMQKKITHSYLNYKPLIKLTRLNLFLPFFFPAFH